MLAEVIVFGIVAAGLAVVVFAVAIMVRALCEMGADVWRYWWAQRRARRAERRAGRQ